ncbi:MAG: 4-hydroxythreonine-4-phosphate dehydrogenase PdxA, partial [Gemmatimonas sp.]
MRLALTLGDPRGIGPEIVGKALSDPRIAALSASAHGPNAVAWRVIGPRGCGLPVHDDLGAWAPTGDAARDEAAGGR